jgi:succinoglycan biosynthesis protein ExoA
MGCVSVKFFEEHVFIVVPTLNEQSNIVACLTSLASQAPTSDIVVVDGGSNDDTCALVKSMAERHPLIKLIHNPKRIQSAGINQAVQTMTRGWHKVLIRCDAHSSYPDNFVAEILKSFAKTRCESVVVSMQATGSNGFSKGASWIVDRLLGNGGSRHRGGQYSGWVDHGHHAGMLLSWFQKLGGYDPTFSHNEDAEFDHRLVAAGGTIWMNGRIQIDYSMRTEARSLIRQYFLYGAGRARTIAKHQLKPKMRQLLPTLNFSLLVASFLACMWWPMVGLFPLAYLLSLIAVSVIAAWRSKQISGLWAGFAMAAMHNSWAVGFLYQRLLRRNA